MPKVERKRTIPASAQAIWSVVSDPYHLPRWWPRTTRVENVSVGDARGSRWTQVLETRDGRGVRADYRCVSAAEGERYVYEQQLEGTPFDGILRDSRTEVRLRPEGAGTEVTLSRVQTLRGLSRLGSPMMRRATARTLSEALSGLESAVSTEAGEQG